MATICMHAFMPDGEGGTTYCEEDDPELSGWCVYTRTDDVENGEPGEFDLSAEMDFDTREEALVQAQARAAMRNCELFIY